MMLIERLPHGFYFLSSQPLSTLEADKFRIISNITTHIMDNMIV